MRSILFALALACAAAPLAAQTAFEPAIIINDEVVTRYDVAQRTRLLRLNGAPAGQADSLAREQLIGDRLKTAAARQYGVEPAESEIDQALRDYAARRNLSIAQLRAALKRAGVAESALRGALAADLGWISAVRRKFGASATPGGAEIDREIAERDVGALVEVVVIQGAGRGAAAQVQRAVNKRPDCESAPGVAQELGLQANRSQPSPVSQLAPILQNAIRELQPGEISDVVRAQGQAAAFVLCTHGDAESNPTAREAFRGQMRSERLERYAEGWLQELMSQAVIDRR